MTSRCILTGFLLAVALGHVTARAQGEPGLITCWRFSPEWKQGTDLKAMAGGPGIPLRGPMRFTIDPLPGRLELSGSDPDLVIAPNEGKATLPRRDLSVETWVRVDDAGGTSGIIGILDDSAERQRGWLLGSRESHFRFALASEGAGQLTVLESSTPYQPRRWHHVVGTYDGTTQRLFVDGEAAGEAREQSGAVAYPTNTPFRVGAIQTGNQRRGLSGALHEIRLFQRSLGADEIRARYQKRRSEFPEPAPAAKSLRLAYGPFVDWKDRSSAVVTWETDDAMPTHLELDVPGGSRLPLSTGGNTRRHEVMLTGLKPDREYHYRILGPESNGTPVQTSRYLFDTSFYYALPPAPRPAGNPDQDRAARVASRILDRSGVRDGYCLVLGAGDGKLALELIRQSHLQVVVVDADEARIGAVRRTLDRAGVYGVRASALRVEPGRLPFSDLFVNLIVSESVLETGEPPFVASSELFRLLRPSGGVAVLGGHAGTFGAAWDRWRAGGALAAAEIASDDGNWLQFRRDPLPGAGEWSHQYGSPDNTSTSLDELVGGDMQVAWWGDPGPRPMPDRGNRNPAPLSVNGRLFIQGDRILFGLDAYNGTILWTLSAPEVRRANVTRDCSNMAAAGDRLYVAHGRWCLAIDGQTGNRAQRFPVEGGGADDSFAWGYVSASSDSLIGSRQKRDAAYLGDDGEWYEDFDTQQTSRVTSDRIFSLDPSTGARRWTYQGGVILNSTITIADGMILFLESRSPAAAAAAGSRVAHELLTDQYLVALDLRTGQRLWDKGHDLSACQYMTYLVYSQGTAVVTGTDKDKHFHTFAFSAPAPGRPGGDDLEKSIPGRLLWSDDHKEDKGHHSGHLQHPLVIDQVFYSDQRAFDLRSGKLLRTDLPERRGCGIMSASRRAVFFRHHFQGMWDLTSNKRSQFEGIRTGCWLGLIPAGGLLLAPESSAGCSCTHAIQTSVGYLPKSLIQR